MLNGKFFVGLPAGMMDHPKGPNRQQTNFFWPDESKMDAAVDTRSKLRNKSQFQQTPERTTDNGVNTNELHKRELSSRIELNDNLPNQQRADVVQHVIGKPSNLRRRDTFSSKIQFYDYDNEPAPPMPRTNKNSKIDVEKNLKNVTKTNYKRISFTENNLREESSKIEGTLKNNEISPRSSATTRNQSVKNLSKSKSMTDISAQNSVKVIENDVKNISISRPSHEEYNQSEEYVAAPRRQVRTTSRPVPPPRRSRPITEHYHDIDDNFDYLVPGRSPEPTKVLNTRRPYRKYDFEPEDFEESYVPARNTHQRTQTSHQQYSHRVVQKRQNNKGQRYEDDYDYHVESRYRDSPKRTFLKKLNSSHDNHCEFVDASCSNTQNLHEISPPPVVDHNIVEGQKPNNLNRIKRSQTITPSTASRAISRAHRHLVSNVAFWSDAEDNSNNNNSKTIRNSAVMRVSVGLPDT